MTIHAIIKEGKAVPTEPMSFAEGTEVTITPRRSEVPEIPKDPNAPSLRDILLQCAGTIDDMPSDWSTNHDHYAWGTPKREE